MLNDVRFALRTLRRSPVFAASAILALALGIGANTAVFSVVYAVLLKPLPFAEPERLVRLYEENSSQGIERGAVGIGTFADWRARTRTLESVAAYTIPFNGETLWTIGDQVQIVKTSAPSWGRCSDRNRNSHPPGLSVSSSSATVCGSGRSPARRMSSDGK
jgi:hypothetical protein